MIIRNSILLTTNISFLSLCLDIPFQGCRIDSIKEEELILSIIFRNLQMFQYYKHLSEHDKKLQSLWLKKPKAANQKLESNTLDHDFLLDWIEKSTVDMKESSILDKFESKEEKTWTENEFINEFRDPTKHSEVSSTNFTTENFELRKKVYGIVL